MLNFLSKTLNVFKSNTSQVVTKDVLLDALLEADVSYEIAEEIIYYLPPQERVNKDDLERVMKTYFLYSHELPSAKPLVTMLIGVNGAGKTTTAAKLANLHKKAGKSVILGAGDTFRAGAIEQLKLWGERLGLPVIASKANGDPASVAFDTISSALARGIEVAIIDTAGRLQNHKNLGAELEKIVRISNKALNGAPHQKLLVIDGTGGQNSINQAKAFNELIKLDGIIITKLDGTAKGGALFGVARELELPIVYIGTGEGVDDLQGFSTDFFVKSIVEAIFSRSH